MMSRRDFYSDELARYAHDVAVPLVACAVYVWALAGFLGL